MVGWIAGQMIVRVCLVDSWMYPYSPHQSLHSTYIVRFRLVQLNCMTESGRVSIRSPQAVERSRASVGLSTSTVHLLSSSQLSGMSVSFPASPNPIAMNADVSRASATKSSIRTVVKWFWYGSRFSCVSPITSLPSLVTSQIDVSNS
jgi:hypothetical protein